MKRTLLAGTALALSFSFAQAADYPAPYAGAYDWSGFYIGAQVGYGWADFDYVFNSNGHYNDGPGDRLSAEADGFFGGGHLGYNWQFDQIVAGIEIVGNVANIEDTDPSYFGGETVTNELEWFVTVAPRIGIPFNNLLLYGKAGLAIGEIRSFMRDFVDYYEETNTHLGWTAGVGLEFGISQRLSLGLEYAYVSFGDKNIAGESLTLDTGAPWGVYTDSDLDADMHTISARMSYRF